MLRRSPAIGTAVASSILTAPLALLTGCPVDPGADDRRSLSVSRIAAGIASPVALAQPDDGSGRLFIVSQVGRILILESDGTLVAQPFLDITDRMVELDAFFDERGLLGLAFHPDYSNNGRLFVFYNAPAAGGSGQNTVCRISEFVVDPANAGLANQGSERILLEVGKPQGNHNGGQLAFGPEGFLYIGFGDGGGAGDDDAGHTPGIGNAQDRSTLLGKICRIDVDGGDPYAVPPDNPFVGDSAARPEIWALGFRNPWRFSFDSSLAAGARLFVGDVGQGNYEEVDIVQRGGNYGWRIREGFECFESAGCDDVDADNQPLSAPIFAYGHDRGISVIGGYIYRGAAIDGLRGAYLFGDYSTSAVGNSGPVFLATEDEDRSWNFEEIAISGQAGGRLGRKILAFGQDLDGEIYVLATSGTSPGSPLGEVYRFGAAP